MYSRTARIIKIAAAAAVTGLFSGCSTEQFPKAFDANDILKNEIVEKARRAGYYRAASQQAEKEGLGDIAVYLSEIAEEEANYIMKMAVLMPRLQKNTKKNITKLVKTKKTSLRNTYPSIVQTARRQHEEDVARLFEEMIQDDKRHFSGLNGILKKMKK
jgi:rubrerythrin